VREITMNLKEIKDRAEKFKAAIKAAQERAKAAIKEKCKKS